VDVDNVGDRQTSKRLAIDGGFLAGKLVAEPSSAEWADPRE
jgi:hypothetical protein